MRIGMVQFRPERRMEMTTRKVEKYIAKAKETDVKILCFPEMSLSGYTLSPNDALLREQSQCLEIIRKAAVSAGMTVLIGGVEKENGKCYIAQYVVGKEIRSYRKMHPGEKEARIYEAGVRPGLFEVDGLRIGIMLCYDSRFPELAQALALMGAEVIFVPTASPNPTHSRIGMWKKYLVARAYDNRVNVAAANLLFGDKGGGMIGYNKSGEILFEHSDEEEYLLIFEPDRRIFDNSSMKHRDFLWEKRKRLEAGAGLAKLDEMWFGGLLDQ